MIKGRSLKLSSRSRIDYQLWIELVKLFLHKNLQKKGEKKLNKNQLMRTCGDRLSGMSELIQYEYMNGV